MAQDLNTGLEAAQVGDFKAAFRNLYPIANQGNADAQFVLGAMYENGNGVAQNDAEAVRWYRVAAEQGNGYAQTNLGFMYANGRGVPVDHTEAVHWYRLAAGQRISNAQYNLGVSYAKGWGVLQDDVLAHMWLNIANAEGNVKGREIRDAIAQKMTREQLADAQARARVCIVSNYRNCY